MACMFAHGGHMNSFGVCTKQNIAPLGSPLISFSAALFHFSSLGLFYLWFFASLNLAGPLVNVQCSHTGAQAFIPLISTPEHEVNRHRLTNDLPSNKKTVVNAILVLNEVQDILQREPDSDQILGVFLLMCLCAWEVTSIPTSQMV
ncbi:MAG: hypothetical protein J3R72DRAFT_421133 [Linnemannia gamsii]|nr:MAG: hypothetical protein J3R72DRAFT_421133 [Linnemannia gamsii]